MRKPDVDPRALRAIVERALPGADRPHIVRTTEGGSTQVYRVGRGGGTFYLRVGEEREDSLGPEAAVHGELRARAVRVPEVVYLDDFDEALERSVMITTEVPGRSLAERHVGVDVRAVLIAAGRDLAVINGIEVAGFGWISRDRDVITRHGSRVGTSGHGASGFGTGRTHRSAPTGQAPIRNQRTTSLEAEFPTLWVFATRGLEDELAAVRGLLTAEEVRAIGDVVVRNDALFGEDRGRLVHGDFDATHIYHQDGAYAGIIDFGEIRGADGCYDLGHYALHDGQSLPGSTLPFLLEGYAAVTPLPVDHGRRVHLWSVLIGVGRLARSGDRPPTPYRDYLAGAVRRSLAQLR